MKHVTTKTALRSRQRYYEFKAMGLCPRCKSGARAVSGYVHCQRCLDYNKFYETVQRAERREAHQCIDCGHDLEPSQRADNRDRCSFCEDRHDVANYTKNL